MDLSFILNELGEEREDLFQRGFPAHYSDEQFCF